MKTMSKSTPISQLQNIGPVQLQTIPEAEAAIQDMAMEYGQGSPSAAYGNSQSTMTGTFASLAPAPPPGVVAAGSRLVSPDDIKLFAMASVIFVLLANEPVINIICSKIPGMKNPLICLVVRAVLAGVLVAAIYNWA
jgi:hypothetical protein